MPNQSQPRKLSLNQESLKQLTSPEKPNDHFDTTIKTSCKTCTCLYPG
jgi:hypothetical protein